MAPSSGSLQPTYEFTGEMERKQNLIRWNLLKAKLDEAKVKMAALSARTGEYADVPTTLYYKFKTDNVSIDIYGLNRGESTNPGAAYTWTTTCLKCASSAGPRLSRIVIPTRCRCRMNHGNFCG